MAELPTGTITLLFTDIEGSTRLLRRVGDAYAGLLAQHRSLLEQAFLAHRGVVVDQEGDAFFVAFASAKDAVAAAADAQRALVSHDWVDENEIRVRMGLHTGEPRVVEGRYVGLDVHQAARVMAVAHGGQVVVSESTQALLEDDTHLRDLGEHRLKDILRPQRLYQLELEGLPSDFPPLATLDNRPTNLPTQPNAFIGRERELAETRALLERDDVRLLTLIGPGGTGKTRLALQLAWNVLEQFRNGVFFVSLAPIRDWELVVPTILRTLGLREQPGETSLETLTEYLREKELLLVLDNFEHVFAAAPAVAGLLESAPDLHAARHEQDALAPAGRARASRPAARRARPAAACGRRGGRGLRVGSAVRRARARRGRRLHPQRRERGGRGGDRRQARRPAAGDRARRAAGADAHASRAAAPSRPASAPADRRSAGPRRAPADATRRRSRGVTTSCWRRRRRSSSASAVFVGGCRLEAAEAVCDFDGTFGDELLDGLDSLVQKSLLRQRQDSDGEPRFWMLETIREFGLELLESAGELEAGCERHAAWTAGEAERLDAESRTGNHPAFLARVDGEYANIRPRPLHSHARRRRRAAAAPGDRALGLLVVARLRRRGQARARGRARAQRPPAGADAARPLHAAHAAAAAAGTLREAAQEALEACEELGDDYSLAQAWNLVGRVEGSVMGSLATAEEAWRQALSFARRGNYRAEKAESISWLMVSAVFGPLPVEEGIARSREFVALEGEDPTIRATCSVERAVLEAMRGDIEHGAGAPGRRAEDDRGSSASRCGTRSTRRRPISSSSSPARRSAAVETLRQSYETLDEGGRARLPLDDRGLSRARALRARQRTTRRSASAVKARMPPPPTTCSHRCSGGQRARRSWRGGASSSAAEALAREAVRIGEPTDLLVHPRRRALRPRRGARAGRPPRGCPGVPWPTAGAVRAKGKPDRARAGARERGAG